MREKIQLIRFPTAEPLPDELEAIKETADETDFISHDEINWD